MDTEEEDCEGEVVMETETEEDSVPPPKIAQKVSVGEREFVGDMVLVVDVVAVLEMSREALWLGLTATETLGEPLEVPAKGSRVEESVIVSKEDGVELVEGLLLEVALKLEDADPRRVLGEELMEAELQRLPVLLADAKLDLLDVLLMLS